MKSWQYSGESAPSSSNLSALAPPFTVVVGPFSSTSNSNPYEPLLGLPSSSSQSTWMNPSPLLSASTWGTSLPCREFDVMNYPVEHEYSTQPVVPAAAYYGQFSDGTRGNVDEVTPYYPQYYSSRVETEKPSVFASQPRFDGLCDDKNQMAVHVGETCGDAAGREQHEPVKLGVDYSTEQGAAADYYSYMSLGAGAHPPIGFGIHGETSADVNLSEGGNHDGRKVQGAVDAKSLPNNPGFTGITSPTTLKMKYKPVLSSAHSETPSLDLFPGSRKDQMKQNYTIQSCMKRSGSNPGDQTFVDFFPAPSTRPQASAPVFEVHPSNHGNGSISPSEHFRADTLHSGKESHVAESSVFGEVPIWFGKSKNEERNTEKVVPNDSPIDLNRGNPGLEFPCMNGYSSSSADAFNHSYPLMGSQCWNRIPTVHFAPSMGPSDFIPGKHLMESEEFDGLKISSQRLNQATFGSEYQSPERNSMFHQNQPCPLIPSAAKPSSPDATEAASLNIRTHGARFDEFTGDDSFEASQTKQNSSEHGVNSQERKLSGHEGSDKGRNISDDSNNGFSDVSFRCVEQVLSSPPSTREATKRTAWYREEVTPKIDASSVVRMMHNLSELLMVCSSNGGCDLKEQDCEILKNATNNLILFCLENRHLQNGRNSKEPEVTFMPDGVFLGEFPGVHATLVEVKNGPGKPSLIPPFVGSEKRHRVFPSFPTQMISDFPVVTGQSSATDDKITQREVMERPEASDNTGKADGLNNPEKNSYAPSSDHSSLSDLPNNIKDDKMTQAIKAILSENFHEDEESEPQVQLFKNLWLEAEAALCSMNYKARYDRVKFEMEKSKSHSENGPSQNTVTAKDLAESGAVANLSTQKKSSGDAPRNHDNLDVSGQSFVGVNDVMARFNILKDRDNKSNLGSGSDGEELMSPEVSSDLKKADELPSETCTSQATISPVRGSTHGGADNMEPAFLSRLSILKQREGNVSAVSPEPDLSGDISGSSLTAQGNSMDTSAWGNWFSMLKQQDDHLSSSESEAEKPPETVNLESSVLARLSILLQRDDNLRSMGQDCTPSDVVNLESVVQKDYFPSTVEKLDTPKDFRSDGPENLTAGRVCDFSSSSDWEHVLKEDV